MLKDGNRSCEKTWGERSGRGGMVGKGAKDKIHGTWGVRIEKSRIP